MSILSIINRPGKYIMHNILIIEDEKSLAFLTTIALSKSGFNVEKAEDGLEGIRKFDEGHFDLVITDILMPGLDGNGVVRHIRNSKRQSTPVIGVSGTPWLLEINDFDAVLSKPSSIKTLVDTVRNLTSSIPK
jgi:DNA-binding response OmpR family regulator